MDGVPLAMQLVQFHAEYADHVEAGMTYDDDDPSDIGVRAAYKRLLGAAFEIGARRVREIALEIIPSARERVFDEAEIDFNQTQKEAQWPYRIVMEVLGNIRDEGL